MVSTKRRSDRPKKARETVETSDLDEMRDLDQAEEDAASRREKGEENPLDGAD